MSIRAIGGIGQMMRPIATSVEKSLTRAELFKQLQTVQQKQKEIETRLDTLEKGLKELNAKREAMNYAKRILGHLPATLRSPESR